MTPAPVNPKVASLITGTLGLILLGLGGLLVLTNPRSQDYERYAAETLSHYLKDDVCMQVAQTMGGALSSYCKTMVDASRPQMNTLIANSTVRHNYLFFSIYTTKLNLPSPIPSYQFETVGAFQQWYTFDKEQL